MADARAEQAISSFQRSVTGLTQEGAVLDAVVALTQAVIPASDLVGVTLLDPDRPSGPRSSDARVRRIDGVQHDLGEGPCLDIWSGVPVVRAPDLPGDRRWPLFAAAAHDLGVGAILAVRMDVSPRVVGALCLYSSRPQSFSSADEETAIRLAALAATVVADLRRSGTQREA